MLCWLLLCHLNAKPVKMEGKVRQYVRVSMHRERGARCDSSVRAGGGCHVKCIRDIRRDTPSSPGFSALQERVELKGYEKGSVQISHSASCQDFSTSSQ
jgi:hypothetical protein